MIDKEPRPIYPTREEINNAPFETLADWLGNLPKAENEAEATLKLWVLERYLAAVLEKLHAAPEPRPNVNYLYLGMIFIAAGTVAVMWGFSIA